MRNTALSLVSPAAPPSVADIASMIAAARAGGATLAHNLASSAEDLSRQASEIVGLGDAVPAGVREEARKLADDLDAAAGRIRAIMSRSCSGV